MFYNFVLKWGCLLLMMVMLSSFVFSFFAVCDSAIYGGFSFSMMKLLKYVADCGFV